MFKAYFCMISTALLWAHLSWIYFDSRCFMWWGRRAPSLWTPHDAVECNLLLQLEWQQHHSQVQSVEVTVKDTGMSSPPPSKSLQKLNKPKENQMNISCLLERWMMWFKIKLFIKGKEENNLTVPDNPFLKKRKVKVCVRPYQAQY